MGYRTLADAVRDLESSGRLRAIDAEIDPHLEAAAIVRRAYDVGGPAILFRRLPFGGRGPQTEKMFY